MLEARDASLTSHHETPRPRDHEVTYTERHGAHHGSHQPDNVSKRAYSKVRRGPATPVNLNKVEIDLCKADH